MEVDLSQSEMHGLSQYRTEGLEAELLAEKCSASVVEWRPEGDLQWKCSSSVVEVRLEGDVQWETTLVASMDKRLEVELLR